MTTANRIRIVVVLLLLCGGVAAYQHPAAFDSVAGLVGYKSKVVQAVIIEESAERSKLPQSQIIAIMKAGEIGVGVVDQNAVGPDGKTPASMSPFIAAAAGKQLPQLTRKWSNGRTTSVAMPADFDKLKEAVK
jgi:hypothetical protein